MFLLRSRGCNCITHPYFVCTIAFTSIPPKLLLYFPFSALFQHSYEPRSNYLIKREYVHKSVKEFNYLY